MRLDDRGVVTVETDMTDIGTGSYTIIAQTAAEMMGVPLDKVVGAARRLGFPGVVRARAASGARNSSTAGVYAACVKLREAVAQKARARRRPTRCSPTARCAPAARSVPLGEAAGAGGLVGRGRHRVRRPRQEVPAVDLRRALRRGRRRRRDRRDARAAHARGVRGGPHPQPEDGAQPGDRRDDDGRRARR